MTNVTIPQAVALALDHHRAGRLNEAWNIYARVLQVAPSHPDTLYLMGQLALTAERYGQAVQLIGSAAVQAPEATAIRVNLGDAHEGLGRLEAASVQYRHAASIRPDLGESYAKLGAVWKTLGHVERALTCYVRAARLAPEEPFFSDNVLLCRYLLGMPLPGDRSWRSEGTPSVTVVIPCYNYGRYVVEAVDSALAQTHPALDVIVVDGGSDCAETLAVLRGLRRPRTRVIFREGRHLVGDNRNAGIALSDSPYVCCLDADDCLEPSYIEKAVFFLDTLGYDIVGARMRFFDGSDLRPRWPYVHRPAMEGLAVLNNIPTAAVFRRAFWEKADGFHDFGLGRDYVYEDWNLWLRMSALGARAVNLDERLFLYRQHGQPRITTQEGLKSQAEHGVAIRAFNRDVLPPALL